MARKYDWDQLASDLFTLLADRSEGVNIHEIQDRLGLGSPYLAHKVIRHLRLILGKGDEIAVPWKADGRRRLYFLSEDAGGEVKQWSVVRQKTALARLDVDIATWDAVARGEDGRTAKGKAARYISRSLDRVREDVRDLFPEEAL